MDRLTGIERPHEPSPTSHGTRVKAGATRLAPGGLWEPHNAYRSRNLKQIQVNHQREDTAVLRQTSPTMATLRVGPIEVSARKTVIRVGLSDGAILGSCSVLQIDLYWLEHQAKSTSYSFPSHMELTSPPIAVCLVSSGTSNEGNIQVLGCQGAPGRTILGTRSCPKAFVSSP
ncbi:hypothetical protein THAOC_08462 [Thalassiosira oceanica]|uniref:Uncharacterized protein n=1 Tax=Thalassiosira oceanica TaxID=159749 RepID=K0SV10_THAOC|nr:hypothetical protein THAOC_08462 [Thalassiosira oceanica]|eukprot:EJK70198.1 hypothetical protein THAOC_08462 [Thalassiosira oceanica]